MSTRTSIAAALLPLLALTACSSGDDSAEAEASKCASVEGELLAADPLEGQPSLEIPLPEGWESNTAMNSEMIRLAVVAPELEKDNLAPNVVVTSEPSPADGQVALDRQLAGLETFADTSGITPEAGEVCGYSAWRFGYEIPEMGQIPARPAEVQVIVVPHGDQAITYTMTAQSTEPVDPAYDEAVDEIFAGVQIGES